MGVHGTHCSWRMRHLAIVFFAIFSLDSMVLADEKGALPHFMSARQKEVNMRRGPGKQYPIDWTIKRPNYPFEVLRAFQDWYQVKDVEGSTGWVKQKMLSSKRFVIVTVPETKVYGHADDNSRPLAIIKQGVIAAFLKASEEHEWCEVELLSPKKKGFLACSHLWGV